MPRKRSGRWKARGSTSKNFEDGLSPIIAAIKKISRTAKTLEELTNQIYDLTYDPRWEALAVFEARRMVQNVSKEDALSWQEAASSAKNKDIFKILKREMDVSIHFRDLILANARVIKSIPAHVCNSLVQKIAKETIAGNRPEAIEELVRETAPELSRSRIRLIARTEVGKTQAAIVQKRSQEIGVNWYVWHTAEDQRVRSAHKHMDDVLCSYANPPHPEVLNKQKDEGAYNPGQIYNCRCYAAPVVNIDLIQFPAKVAYQGHIVRMSKKSFLEIQGK